MFVDPTLLPLCPVYCTEVLQCILFSLIVGTREGKSGHYIEGKRMCGQVITCMQTQSTHTYRHAHA